MGDLWVLSGDELLGAALEWLFISERFASEDFFDGSVAVDEAVAGFVVDAFGADVGGGGGDDFFEVPGEEVGVGGEDEGDGATEHGTGIGVAVEQVEVNAAVGELCRDGGVEGADFRFLHDAILVMLVVPLDRSDAGEFSFGQVFLNASSSKDSVGDALRDVHEEGVGVVACDIASSRDEEEAAKVAVFHYFAPVGTVITKAPAGKAHAVGVSALFDSPFDRLLNAVSVNDASPLAERCNSKLHVP